jgi:hypothetical protein
VSSEIEFLVVKLAIEFSGNNDLTDDHQTGGADQQIKKLYVIPRDCVAKTPKGPPQMSMSQDQDQHPETVQPIGLDAMSDLQEAADAAKNLEEANAEENRDHDIEVVEYFQGDFPRVT